MTLLGLDRGQGPGPLGEGGSGRGAAPAAGGVTRDLGLALLPLPDGAWGTPARRSRHPVRAAPRHPWCACRLPLTPTSDQPRPRAEPQSAREVGTLVATLWRCDEAQSRWGR